MCQTSFCSSICPPTPPFRTLPPRGLDRRPAGPPPGAISGLSIHHDSPGGRARLRNPLHGRRDQGVHRVGAAAVLGEAARRGRHSDGVEGV